MSDLRFVLVVDDDVPVTPLLKAIAATGVRFSNLDGFTFRIHLPPPTGQAVSLAAARPLLRLVSTNPTPPGAT